MASRGSLEAVCEVHQCLPCLEACLFVQGVTPKKHVKDCTRELSAAPGAGMVCLPIPQVSGGDHCTRHKHFAPHPSLYSGLASIGVPVLSIPHACQSQKTQSALSCTCPSHPLDSEFTGTKTRARKACTARAEWTERGTLSELFSLTRENQPSEASVLAMAVHDPGIAWLGQSVPRPK